MQTVLLFSAFTFSPYPREHTGSGLTHTVLLFSVVLSTVHGSGAFGVFPEWTSAMGAPSARSKRFPVATSAREEKQTAFLLKEL